MSEYLQAIRSELLNGKGFILFKGFPVKAWGNQKSAVAYMGLGTYLGYFISQNGKGHVLGHVKDLGDDAKQIDKVRIYRTNARYIPSSSSLVIDRVLNWSCSASGRSQLTFLIVQAILSRRRLRCRWPPLRGPCSRRR